MQTPNDIDLEPRNDDGRPHSYLRTDGEHGDHAMRFYVRYNGQDVPVLELYGSGEVWVHGHPAGNDIEIMNAMREFFGLKRVTHE